MEAQAVRGVGPRENGADHAELGGAGEAVARVGQGARSLVDRQQVGRFRTATLRGGHTPEPASTTEAPRAPSPWSVRTTPSIDASARTVRVRELVGAGTPTRRNCSKPASATSTR